MASQTYPISQENVLKDCDIATYQERVLNFKGHSEVCQLRSAVKGMQRLVT